jgi:Phospholipid methyltransferase
MAACGEALRVWASGHLNKAREVTRSGPYRWLAHPLYVGSAVIGAGLAVASRSTIAASIVVAYLAVTLTAAARSEEATLGEKFGEEYARYRRGLASPDAASDRRFSIGRALANREQRAVAGLLAGWSLLALKLLAR